MVTLQFSGYGIDIRKRAIWDMFGDKADLRVSKHLFPHLFQSFHFISHGIGFLPLIFHVNY